MKVSNEIKLKLDRIVDYLKAEGCSKILLFGSLAEGGGRAHSDIDIAVSGISSKSFFKATGGLSYLIKHKVDLVDLDDLPLNYQETIEQNGVLLYAAS